MQSFKLSFPKEITFLQGLDPITDFRGGGLLSLEQLCYFAETNSEIIDKINERANHVKTGYGLAITGKTVFDVLNNKVLKKIVLKIYEKSK